MPAPCQVLVIRLSSLGDVILATGAIDLLTHRNPRPHIDVLVSTRFAAPFATDIRIRRLWTYDRNTGLKGWLALITQLKAVGYDEIFDLQQSLRTLLLCAAFFGSSTRIRTLFKDRNRSELFLIFKGALPKYLRPRRRALLMARVIDPSVRHIRTHLSPPPSSQRTQAQWIGVMPSSAHPGKEWPLGSWLSLIQSLQLHLPANPLVILGLEGTLSGQLVDACNQEGLTVTSAIQEPTGPWIARLKALLCVDTGLMHWAEASGVPVFALFGPTHPDLGFGPLLPKSQTLLKPTWCQPCSFSGKFCFRLDKPYTCLKDFAPSDVSRKVITFIRTLP